jgi:predicted nucleotidyltransferase
VTTQENILSVLRSKKPELEKKYHISQLALFGSYSRNAAQEGSDVDIMVEFHNPPGILFIDLADELEEMLNHKVDLVSRKAIKPAYFQLIQPQLIYV